jgi:uncharacterized membrane protein
LRSWLPVPAAAAVVLACLLTIGAGYLLKARCPAQDGGSYPPLCYTDVTALYASRGLESGVVPYLDFPADGEFGDPGFLEYPVATGAVMWAATRTADSAAGYLGVNAIILGSVALVGAALLTRRAAWTAMRWAAAPLLALYAFHNWDLLAVGCAIAGCIAQGKGRAGWAGFWFGVGAAAKLYPIFFLVALVLDRLWDRDRRAAARAAGAGIVAVAIPNLAVAIANPDGWWATYAFHSSRGADIGSLWSVVGLGGASATALNLASGVAMLGTGGLVLAVGWWRARRESKYPFLAVGSALVVVFLVWSKVASPQYVLWLLPSLVLLRIGLRWWLGWNAVAVAVYLASFGVGLLPGYGIDMAPVGITAAAAVRTVALVGLGIVVLWASPIRALERARAGSALLERVEPQR